MLLHPASSLDLGLSSSLSGGGGGGGLGGGGGGTVVDVAPGAAGAGVGAGPQLIVYGAPLQTRKPFLLTMAALVLTMDYGYTTYQGALLQTKKPFLTSCIAVPALPALLLCAQRVDASA